MGFGNSFVKGMEDGESAYFKLQQLQMEREAAERARETHARNKALWARDDKQYADESDAYNTMVGLRKNGVVTGNTSGMSNESAQALNLSGGQALADETARLGNAEEAMLGNGPRYQVSGPQQQYDETGKATGQAAMSGPTLQTRTANPRDNLQALYSLAAAKRAGPEVFAALDAKGRELDKEDVYSKYGNMSDDEIHNLYPQLNARHMSGLPINDAGEVVDAKGRPTGYRKLIIGGADGKDNIITLNPAQVRQVAVAYGLMQSGFGQDGMALLGTVSKDIAGVVEKYNANLATSVNTGNDVNHKRNTDHNGAVTAGAAAMNAQTNKAYKDKQIEALDNAEKRRVEAGELIAKLNQLDPSEADYAVKRRKLLTEIDAVNLKPGGQISLRDPGDGRGSVLKKAVIQQKNDDGTFTYVDKETGQPLYNGLNGEKMPLGMEVTEFKALKQEAAKAGVTMRLQENNAGELRYVFVGPSGEPMLTPKEAAMSKAPTKDTPVAKPTAMPGPTKIRGEPIRGPRGAIVGYTEPPAQILTVEEAQALRARNKMPPLTSKEIAEAQRGGLIK